MLLGSVLPAVAESIADHGKALVEVNCARCHAIGKTDKSTHPDAPAFRTLSKRYPITDLEEALAEGILTGHPDMPEWVASPDQIEAIIAYISSLQQP
ncbi:cytochrome c [Mesorhizobium caraganae]